MAKPFIHIDNKNGNQYASIYTPKRTNGKKDNQPKYLGKIINKQQNIYYNKKQGTFQYTIENGYQPYTPNPNNNENTNKTKEEKLILDFGDAYTLHQTLTKTGLHNILTNLLPKQADTTMALINYKLLTSTTNKYANDWLTGSYTNIIYPKANLHSQRLSQYYQQIGEEKMYVFRCYGKRKHPV